MRIEIMVLNYNGKELLAECLPSFAEAVKNSKNECTLSIVDNKSEDGSVEFLKEKFPEFNVYVTDENRVLCSFNEMVENSKADILILMNNDIKVDKNFIDPLVEHFTDSKVFYAAPKVLNFDGTFNGGKSYLSMKYGIMKVNIDKETYDEQGITHTIGCGAFRKDNFLKLGGYDPIYLPGYWEDTDICYRGLKEGLKGIYEPKSMIYHKEHSSFSKSFSWYKKMSIVDRNMFIFMWKNISDTALWAKHIILVIPHVFAAAICGRSHLLVGFFKALFKIPQIIKRRKAAQKVFSVKDRDIIS